jgi:hypothetical protein
MSIQVSPFADKEDEIDVSVDEFNDEQDTAAVEYIFEGFEVDFSEKITLLPVGKK